MPPHFSMSLPGWHRENMIRWKLYLTTVGDTKETFNQLHVHVMGNTANLTNFDGGHTVVVRQLSMSMKLYSSWGGCKVLL